MSFDLYLCRVEGRPISEKQIRGALASIDNMAAVDNDGRVPVQYEYNNPATGVYCSFEIETKQDTEAEEAFVPEGLKNCVSINVNYLRPHFFGLETMPIISALATSLGLFLYDPQDEQTYEPGPSSEALIRSWTKHNESATKAVAQGDDPIRKPFLSRERSLYWWQYMKAREGFQRGMSEDAFVPSILLMTDSEQRVKFTVIWSAEVEGSALPGRIAPIPQVFPVFDHLFLCWAMKGRPFEKAFASASDSEPLLAPLLEAFDGPVHDLRILRAARQDAAAAVFERLPRTSLEVMGIQQIAADAFVDVEVG